MIKYIAMHIFTDRSDLARGIFLRAAGPYDGPDATLIQYPHAASYFVEEVGLSPQYMSSVLSRRRGRSPVLLSCWGIGDPARPLAAQGVNLYWALDGKHIYHFLSDCEEGKIKIIEDIAVPSAKSDLAARFPEALAIMEQGRDRLPAELGMMLSNALGIFIGGETMQDFLEREGAKKANREFPALYKLDHRYCMPRET